MPNFIKLILSGISMTWFLFASDPALAVGDSAPDFSLRDENGELHSLRDYRGSRLVLYFFPKAETPG
jgi:peroxiredoxin